MTMKFTQALGVLAVSSCLSAGCANTGAPQLTGSASTRAASGAFGGGMSGAVARGIGGDRVGASLSGGIGRDEFRVNESASPSERDPQFAGPTPQVPIPHDGRHGQPTDW